MGRYPDETEEGGFNNKDEKREARFVGDYAWWFLCGTPKIFVPLKKTQDEEPLLRVPLNGEKGKKGLESA